MDSIAVLLARASVWVESYDLNPRGAVFYLDLAKAITARYKFEKFPQKLEDFDESKGVIFASGKLGGTVIEQLAFYTYGIVLDTRVSTDESKRLLEEGLQWASKEFGLPNINLATRRWQYESSVTFHSKVRLLSASPAFEKLADNLTKGVREVIGENLSYDMTILALNYDQLLRKHPLRVFSIQRRENTPFSENKYFSEAPLPTERHIHLLKEFEADLTSK
jgi:hypothetical protein